MVAGWDRACKQLLVQRFSAPRLNIQTVEHDSVRFVEILMQSKFQLGEFVVGDEVQGEDPLTEVVDKVDKKLAAG